MTELTLDHATVAHAVQQYLASVSWPATMPVVVEVEQIEGRYFRVKIEGGDAAAITRGLTRVWTDTTDPTPPA